MAARLLLGRLRAPIAAAATSYSRTPDLADYDPVAVFWRDFELLCGHLDGCLFIRRRYSP